jgi:hypothetical protein
MLLSFLFFPEFKIKEAENKKREDSIRGDSL